MSIPYYIDILERYDNDKQSELDKIEQEINDLYIPNIKRYIDKYYYGIIENKIIEIRIFPHKKKYRDYIISRIKLILLLHNYEITKCEYYEYYNKEENTTLSYAFYSIS